MAQTIAFLHGLGESPTVWRGVTSAPELASYEYVTPALFGLIPEIKDLLLLLEYQYFGAEDY